MTPLAHTPHPTMNSKENHMTKRQKISIARIFSDLIKADRIIDTGEMDCWERLCEKYSIDREAMTEAQGVSFAEAVETICSAEEQGLREDLLGDCRSMTISDGFCAHAEALVIIALTMVLESSHPFRADVISIPKANFNIDVATALYVESDFDTMVNEAIVKDYRTIYKELQLAGFHFVYIPSIIAHYRRTDPGIIRGILSFLAPNLSPDGLDTAYSSLLEMTTGAFCKDLLCNKCGIADLRDTYPAILVKIGTSYVGETPYANYLKIEADENITTGVRMFVDRFCDMLPSDLYIVKTSTPTRHCPIARTQSLSSRPTSTSATKSTSASMSTRAAPRRASRAYLIDTSPTQHITGGRMHPASGRR